MEIMAHVLDQLKLKVSKPLKSKELRLVGSLTQQSIFKVTFTTGVTVNTELLEMEKTRTMQLQH